MALICFNITVIVYSVFHETNLK